MSWFAFGSLLFFIVLAAIAAVGVTAYFLVTSWYRRAAAMLFSAGAATASAISWQQLILQLAMVLVGLALIVLEVVVVRRHVASGDQPGSSRVRIASGNRARKLTIKNVEVVGSGIAQIASANRATDIIIDGVATTGIEDANVATNNEAKGVMEIVDIATKRDR